MFFLVKRNKKKKKNAVNACTKESNDSAFFAAGVRLISPALWHPASGMFALETFRAFDGIFIVRSFTEVFNYLRYSLHESVSSLLALASLPFPVIRSFSIKNE